MRFRSPQGVLRALLATRPLSKRARAAVAGLAVLVVAGAVIAVAASGSSQSPRSGSQGGAFAGWNWVGHVASVKASWTVPRILVGSSPGFAATWIGADGPGQPSPFIQIGINVEKAKPTAPGVSIAPTASYWAFWSDTRHGYRGRFLFDVSAGDRITASLVFRGGRCWPAIEDVTSRRLARFSTRDETGAAFTRAGWTQEHVMDRQDADGYPSLSTVTFSDLAINGSPPSQDGLYPLTMTLNDQTSIVPSPVTHDSFTVGQPAPGPT